MRVAMNIPASRALLEAALEGLVAVNYLLLRRDATVPELYSSGVVYRREGSGREEWQTATETLALGYGDCEDLAAWRAAEYRLAGVPARAAVVRTGPRRFHAVVHVPDGLGSWVVEDPARILYR